MDKYRQRRGGSLRIMEVAFRGGQRQKIGAAHLRRGIRHKANGGGNAATPAPRRSYS